MTIPILSAAGQDAIREIVRSRALVALDFDGTLAPIVADRDAARPRATTAALLRTAAVLFPCAVVSGRSRADLRTRLPDAPFVAVVGSHGAEPAFGPLDRDQERQVSAWRKPLVTALGGEPGIDVEDKRFSIAVHYRAAPSWDVARRRILRATAALPRARVFDGHAVVNVVPADAPNKGNALAEVCRKFGARRAVYVGDDTTDEEAFRSDAVAFSVRVGAADGTAARYSIPDQDAIDLLLRSLIAERAEQDGLGARWEALVRLMSV